MKTLIVACAFLIATSGAAGAALPPKPYLGIYADQDHTKQSVTPAVNYPFSVWFLCLPSENGLVAIAFHVTYPSNIIVTLTVANPWMSSPTLDCPLTGEPGLCAVFGDCQLDWVWTHRLTCLAYDDLPSFIEVGPLSYESVLEAATCQPGNPTEPVTILNKFGINQNGVIAGEPQSWGAIKSLYR